MSKIPMHALEAQATGPAPHIRLGEHQVVQNTVRQQVTLPCEWDARRLHRHVRPPRAYQDEEPTELPGEFGDSLRQVLTLTLILVVLMLERMEGEMATRVSEGG